MPPWFPSLALLMSFLGQRGGSAVATVVLASGAGPAGSTSAAATEYRVAHIRTLLSGLAPGSGHVDWSSDGQWIAFDRVGGDGFSDVYRVHPDGSGDECLTCAHPDLPNRHQGNSDWHPGGRFLVFQAELASHILDAWHGPCAPGSGFFNDLYVLDLASVGQHEAHLLTRVRSGAPAGGSLHPHFSHDGSRLFWGDLEGAGGYYGNWRLAVADFVPGPGPRLDNVRYYEPARLDNWYESHGWSRNGDRLYFT